MRQSPAASDRPGRTDETSTESVLAVLEDENCRAILEATSTETLSAKEIADSCEIALSTTYRKLEELTEAGLLHEQLRIVASGKHTSEYTVQVEEITVSIDPETGVQVDIGQSAPDRSPSILAGAD